MRRGYKVDCDYLCTKAGDRMNFSFLGFKGSNFN